MKCNCKSAGSRNTALAFIKDITCVSKKGRRVRKVPLLHLLRRSIAPKCTRMPWNGDERVRSERDKTPLLHVLAISIALTKIGRRIRKTPHLRLLTMSLFHLFLRELYSRQEENRTTCQKGLEGGLLHEEGPIGPTARDRRFTADCPPSSQMLLRFPAPNRSSTSCRTARTPVRKALRRL